MITRVEKHQQMRQATYHFLKYLAKLKQERRTIRATAAKHALSSYALNSNQVATLWTNAQVFELVENVGNGNFRISSRGERYIHEYGDYEGTVVGSDAEPQALMDDLGDDERRRW